MASEVVSTYHFPIKNFEHNASPRAYNVINTTTTEKNLLQRNTWNKEPIEVMIMRQQVLLPVCLPKVSNVADN